MIAERDLYLDSGKTVVVDAGSPEAAFLLVRAGKHIPAAYAGLVPKPKPEPKPKAAIDPVKKRTVKKARKAPADKARKAGGDK